MSELADEVAVEVMGWHIPRGNTPGGCMWVDANELLRYHINTWSPDTRWDHVGMVLDKMWGEGWNYRIVRGQAWFWSQIGEFPELHTSRGDTDGEAVCRAALAAKRAET